MKTIYLLCGPSGSGKTWVAEQLHHKFMYVSHDEFEVNMYEQVLINKAKISQRPILGDCPFRISDLIKSLRKKKIEVIPIFIVEPRHEVIYRIIKRDGIQGVTQKRMNRIDVLKKRADEFATFKGTAKEVLDYLQKAKV